MRLYGHLSHIYTITNLLEKYFIQRSVGKSVKRFKFFFSFLYCFKIYFHFDSDRKYSSREIKVYIFLSNIISLAATFGITDKAIYYIVWINIYDIENGIILFRCTCEKPAWKNAIGRNGKIYEHFFMPFWGSMCESS